DFLVSKRGVIRKMGQHGSRGMPQPLADLVVELARQWPYVIAAIAVLRKRQFFATDLEIAQPGTHGEDVHLATRVVDVVLARYRETNRAQNVREGCAVSRLT